MRNYDLLESQFKENLTKEDRELLKSLKPNLEKLQELKMRLLEKNVSFKCSLSFNLSQLKNH